MRALKPPEVAQAYVNFKASACSSPPIQHLQASPDQAAADLGKHDGHNPPPTPPPSSLLCDVCSACAACVFQWHSSTVL